MYSLINFITAIIRDGSGRGHIRHIKRIIGGDYWVTDIDRQTFVFKIDDSRITTYKETAARSCRILFYSTKHYLPISAEKNKELEEILRINSMPRMNTTMYGAFKLLSQREKQKRGKDFENHNIGTMIDNITKTPKVQEKYQIQIQNLKTYFENMAIYEVVTPVKEITEFIEDDLLATDPKFLGDIYNAIQRTDFEHKKVTNQKVDAKKPWMLIIALCAIIGVVVFAGFYLIQSGTLQNLLPNLGGASVNPASQNPNATPPPGQKMSDAAVFSKYSDASCVHQAIAKGDLSLNQLSPAVQNIVKNYKPSPTDACK